MSRKEELKDSLVLRTVREKVNSILFEEPKEKRAALALHAACVTEKQFLEMVRNTLEWQSDEVRTKIANHLRDLERGN